MPRLNSQWSEYYGKASSSDGKGNYRSSLPEVFLRKGVLKTCSKITLRYRCSPVNLLNIFRTPFLKNTSEITSLHEELKSNNTIITILLEKAVKLKDNHNNKNRSIHSNNDVKTTQSEKMTLNQLNQLKQWKEKSSQQNH